MKLSMKRTISKETKIDQTLRRVGGCLVAALLTLACMPASAGWDRDRDGEYVQTNLLSDLPGVALLQDTNLVNAWGIGFSAASPFWISDNGSGLRLCGDIRCQWHRQTRRACGNSRRRQSYRAIVQWHDRVPSERLHFRKRRRHHLWMAQRPGHHGGDTGVAHQRCL